MVIVEAFGLVAGDPPSAPLSLAVAPDALSAQPDLVVLDAEDCADRSTWARIATERARGTSFVVGTANVDQACRSDRIALASWGPDQLRRALPELVRQMTNLVEELLAVLGDGRDRRSASLAADLRRLNVGARALLDEMRRCARAEEDWRAWQSAATQVARASVGDRGLDAGIAEAEDR